MLFYSSSQNDGEIAVFCHDLGRFCFVFWNPAFQDKLPAFVRQDLRHQGGVKAPFELLHPLSLSIKYKLRMTPAKEWGWRSGGRGKISAFEMVFHFLQFAKELFRHRRFCKIKYQINVSFCRYQMPD